MRTLNAMFNQVILNNELSGNLRVAYEFSHASGGTSGYSFGRCQFDVRNNSTARSILSKLGFTAAEVLAIQDETVDPRQWNARLAAGSEIIDDADTTQLSYCLDGALDFATSFGVPVTNPEGILALADAINQYGSIGAGCAEFLKALDHPVVSADVLAWRLQTKYGKECPTDCKRRIAGVMQVVNAA